jgi:hypothetical protein
MRHKRYSWCSHELSSSSPALLNNGKAVSRGLLSIFNLDIRIGKNDSLFLLQCNKFYVSRGRFKCSS